MAEKPSLPQPEEDDEPHVFTKWTRIYLHGLIAMAVVFAFAYAVSRLIPIFDVGGNRPLAIGLAIAAIVIGPPLVGSLIIYGLFPLLGRKEGLRGLLVWDDRLISEVTAAREKARIVIINWPSEEVRTMGVLTSTFVTGTSGDQYAAVYVPTAPQTKLGYIRVVSLDDVEFTDWTLKQWQLYHLTFGSACPGKHTT